MTNSGHCLLSQDKKPVPHWRMDLPPSSGETRKGRPYSGGPIRHC
jgi:hypothetical protein